MDRQISREDPPNYSPKSSILLLTCHMALLPSFLSMKVPRMIIGCLNVLRTMKDTNLTDGVKDLPFCPSDYRFAQNGGMLSMKISEHSPLFWMTLQRWAEYAPRTRRRRERKR